MNVRREVERLVALHGPYPVPGDFPDDVCPHCVETRPCDASKLAGAMQAVLELCAVEQRDFDRRQTGDPFGAAAPAILRVEDVTAAFAAHLVAGA